jgi:hypothetical protein
LNALVLSELACYRPSSFPCKYIHHSGPTASWKPPTHPDPNLEPLPMHSSTRFTQLTPLGCEIKHSEHYTNLFVKFSFFPASPELRALGTTAQTSESRHESLGTLGTHRSCLAESVQGLGCCISNKLPVATDTADPHTT